MRLLCSGEKLYVIISLLVLLRSLGREGVRQLRILPGIW